MNVFAVGLVGFRDKVNFGSCVKRNRFDPAAIKNSVSLKSKLLSHPVTNHAAFLRYVSVK